MNKGSLIGHWSAVNKGVLAVILGAAFVPSFGTGLAKADAQEVVNNVIRNIVENVRDDVRRRAIGRSPAPPFRFSAEGSGSTAIYDEAFAALAYNGMPTKARPLSRPPPVLWIYGVNVIGSYDVSRADGTRTRAFTLAGAGDITKIGIFTSSDALTFILTGAETWLREGVHANASTVAGTLAYINGNFSTDHTFSGLWINSNAVGGDSRVWSYAGNVQYRFDLANAWFIEPTVGVTVSEARLEGIGATFVNGVFVPGTGGGGTFRSVEVHGGARIGTEAVWNGIRVQPSATGLAFSPVRQDGGAAGAGLPGGLPGFAGGAGAEGHVGGRGSVKANFLWTDKFSSFIEGHVSGIDNTISSGVMGGLRFTL